MPSTASGLCVVFVTCPSRAVADGLTCLMIRQHVAACVNIVGPVRSVFWWQGKVDRAREYLLVIKMTRRRLPALRRLLKTRHPYTVPELVVLPIVAGLPAYLRWVHASCR